VSNQNAKPTFVRWWLGGFGGAGAIVAGALTAMFDVGFLPSLGDAVLGRMDFAVKHLE
jgi:hypothetical protein